MTSDEPYTSQNHKIHEWGSILTLIVFLLTNLVVVFPFTIPIPIHARLVAFLKRLLSALHIVPTSGETRYTEDGEDRRISHGATASKGAVLTLPFNFVTMPVLSVLVLTAMQVIGKNEYRGGIIGANNINPIDIMAFFLTLAYLAISIDATGLIRFLAFWVLKKGGKNGHRLYFLLFAFFFGLGSFIGNDPIILSGTAFLAYLTRLAANIRHPRAWIYAQFAVANISSAILVSSNPTNLVLSGAFALSFVHYTLNMIIPVIITGIVLFPFLLYIIFPSEDLIPYSIGLQSMEDENVADITDAEKERRQTRNAELAEIIDPFLDGKGALFGGVLLAITLTTLLATNAAGLHPGVWTMTVPAGFIMLCRDLWYDWGRREQTRQMAKDKKIEKARKIKLKQEAKERRERERLGHEMAGEGTNGNGMVYESEAGGALGLSVDGSVSGASAGYGHRQHHIPGDSTTVSNDYTSDDEKHRDDEMETAEDIAEHLVVDVHPLGRHPSENDYEGFVLPPSRRFESSPTESDFEANPAPLPPHATAHDRFPGRTPAQHHHHRQQTLEIPSPDRESLPPVFLNDSPEDFRRPRALSAASQQHQTYFPRHSPPPQPHHELPPSSPAASPRELAENDDPMYDSPFSSSDEMSYEEETDDRPSYSEGERGTPDHRALHQSPITASPPTTEKDLADAFEPDLPTSSNGHLPTKGDANANGTSEHANGDATANLDHSTSRNADPAAAHKDRKRKKKRTVYGAWHSIRRYSKETFPTVSAVIGHLPFALLPFAFSMFILVQGLVTKGWVDVWADGWGAWVKKTGTVGAIGGMGFCSVLLCNFAGTNIGTSILLSRILQSWFNKDHLISDRDRDASIYALALGVNYGAFSAAFNASLAGLLWRDILRRKHINVKRLDFARVNLPIIAIAMSVGCGVLTAQVYLVKSTHMRDQGPVFGGTG